MALKSLASWNRFNRLVLGDYTTITQQRGLNWVAPTEPDDEWRQELISDIAQTYFITAPKGKSRTANALTSFLTASVGRDRGRAVTAKHLELVRERTTRTGEQVELVRERTTRTGLHAWLQYRIRKHEIVGGGFQIHLDARGPYAVSGRLDPTHTNIDPGPQPRFRVEEVRRACHRLFDVSRTTEVDSQLVVFPTQSQTIWAYRCHFMMKEPVEVEAYLAADGLDLLLSHNIVSAVSGQALVHRVNPSRTPKLNTVRVWGISADTPGRLSGRRVTVRPQNGRRLSRPNGDFRLQPATRGFDEVQAYHHVRSARAYFAKLAGRQVISGLSFSPIKVVVRDPAAANNAYYVPGLGELRFGDFDGVRPSAASADVVYHEFGHAVSDTVCQLSRGLPDSESRGLSEGYSDYFACSALGDPRIGDYVVGTQTHKVRDCSSTAARFPPGYVGEEHAMGNVWACVLWELNQVLGAPTMDEIAIESLQFLNPASRFEDGLAALIAADRKLHQQPSGQGIHEAQIEASFDARRPT